MGNADNCEHRAQAWEELWHKGMVGPEVFAEEFKQAWDLLQAERKKEKRSFMTLQGFHEALFTFNKRTGKGSDQVGPDFFKALPREAKLEIVATFNAIQSAGVWPWQWLHVLVLLIPKAAGGERPIGLLPFLVRVFFRMCRGETRKWADARHGHWDTAIRGSSALQAAIKRALRIECAKTMDVDFALLLVDIVKFYDSVRIPALILAGLELGYSPLLLGLNVQIS